MSQADRERALRKTILRYENWQAGSHSVGGRRMADDFFCDVVAREMDANGRAAVEQARTRFMEALKMQVADANGAGRPKFMAAFWNKLGLPRENDELEAAAGLLFYITVHQLVETMLSEIRDDEILEARQQPDSERHGEAEDAETGTETNADPGAAPPLDEPLSDPDGSSSQQQLYIGIWRTIVLEIAFREAVTPAERARLKAAFASHSGMSDRIAHDLVRKFEEDKAIEEHKGVQFAATLTELVNASLAEPWFKRVQGGTTRTYKVVPQKSFLRIIGTMSKETITLQLHAPMIEPPIAWQAERGLKHGGFHVLPLPFFKFHWKNERIRDFLKEVDHPAYFTEIFSAMNALQNTAWAVNRRVWEVVRSLYDIAGVPLAGGDDLFSASTLEAVAAGHGDAVERLKRLADDNRASAVAALAPETRKAWRDWIGKSFYVKKRFHRKGAGARLNSHLALGTLLDALRRERIYFAYQADARGRVYPVSGSFSPQGDELIRALLEFAEAKELTDEGARYLAIQGSQHVNGATILAALGRNNERRSPTLDERVQWIERHSASIVACADDPLANRWWCEVAKSEFMFLAFCFAWADWRRGKEAGSKVYCALPIYVDGTCNGLQHIAAITRDAALAKATNVLPAALPRDIYGELADVVRDRMLKFPKERKVKRAAEPPLDAVRASGWISKGKKARRVAEPISDADRARVIEFLNGPFITIDRPMAKSVVMIIPYGAGLETYRQEIAKLLADRLLGEYDAPVANAKAVEWFLGESVDASLPLDVERRRRVFAWLASAVARHLAEHFDDALDELFPIIKQFKQRLTSAAAPVFARGLPLMWVSPSGLPVLQDSFVLKAHNVDIKSLRNRVRFSMRTKLKDISRAAQQSALLPNFIHSCDAAHLVKTVNLAHAAGITALATVHDCYATHASDTAKLGECIRKGFLEVYPEPLDRLSVFEQWCRRLAKPEADPGAQASDLERVLLDLAKRWVSEPQTYDEPAKPRRARKAPTDKPPADTVTGEYWVDQVLDSTYFFS